MTRKSGILLTLEAAATIKGQATAPTLHEKLRRLRAAPLRPGLSAATNKLMAVIATPRPVPQLKRQISPATCELDGSEPTPTALPTTPPPTANRSPHRLP